MAMMRANLHARLMVNGRMSVPLVSETAKLSMHKPMARMMRDKSVMLCYYLN
jgi:hypothetical protein